MSDRKWQPGDVALFTTMAGDELIVFRHRDINCATDEWMSATEGGAYPLSGNLRPLVTIDPEDREAVERLIVAFDYFAEPTAVHHVDRMQAALREFADPKPPRPDEPMGLGAVVEDAEGGKYLAVDTTGHGEYRWARDKRVSGEWLRYDDIDAVKVLSEGVR